MSLFDCIERARAAGEMEGTRAGDAQALYNQLVEMYRPHMGEDAAAAKASADAKRIMREKTERRRRLVLKQVQTAQRLATGIRDYRNLSGEADAADALPALLENDGAARFESVSQIRNALRGRYHRLMTDFLRQHGRNVVGQVRNKAKLDNIVRELMGEGTGDVSAREMAGAISAALEQARLDFNAAGGDIGRLDGWGLPHSHDASRIRDAGETRAERFEAWRASIEPELDWARIVDFETEMPMDLSSPARRTEFLREIFEDIASDGWSKQEPKFRHNGTAVANRRADHRVLHFRNADAWMRYNRAFGRADVFQTVITHLDGLARDTAMMRVLGPNPAAGLEFARQVAMKQARTSGWQLGFFNRRLYDDEADKVNGRGDLARNMLAHLSGEGSRPLGGPMSRFLAGYRNTLTSAKLGGAMLSAVSDVGFEAMAAQHLGMSAGKVIARQARLLASSGERAAALRSGLIADTLANVGVAQARFNMESAAPEITERLAEATMRLSGLTAWTEAGRHAFQLEMMGFLADMTGKAWDDLPDPIRTRFLEARGFDARQWDVIRSTRLHRDPSGATFLVPDDIRHRTDISPEEADGLSLRLMGAIQEQSEFAVPSGTLRGRALVLRDNLPGTLTGELIRSGLMFKNFALTIAFLHMRRLLASDRGAMLGQMAYFFGMTTLMGAASLQLKEVAKGRDPRPMTSAAFVGAAMAQGGGLGIMGDFLFAAQNRFGGSVAQTIAGPGVGTFADAVQLGWRFGEEIYTGENQHTGRHMVRFLRQNTPLSSVWYWSLPVQRHGFDNLQRALDPEASKAFRRAERRRQRQYGNPSWWPAGEAAPIRAPDLETAIGAQ